MNSTQESADQVDGSKRNLALLNMLLTITAKSQARAHKDDQKRQRPPPFPRRDTFEGMEYPLWEQGLTIEMILAGYDEPPKDWNEGY